LQTLYLSKSSLNNSHSSADYHPQPFEGKPAGHSESSIVDNLSSPGKEVTGKLNVIYEDDH